MHDAMSSSGVIGVDVHGECAGRGSAHEVNDLLFLERHLLVRAICLAQRLERHVIVVQVIKRSARRNFSWNDDYLRFNRIWIWVRVRVSNK